MLCRVLLSEAAVARRQKQNLASPRPDARAVVPSIRSFAQAIDRQRQAVERIPVLSAARPDFASAAHGLDEAEAAALGIEVDEPASDLPRFADAARAVGVPVLRTDLVLEEFQVYETRAGGGDALLLHAQVLNAERLPRLCDAARATHMAACVVCADATEVARATQARAAVVALLLDKQGALRPEASLAVPRRMPILCIPTGAIDVRALVGLADAVLDPGLGMAPDPAQAFKDALAQEE